MQADSGVSPFILAAYFHHLFLCTHPFSVSPVSSGFGGTDPRTGWQRPSWGWLHESSSRGWVTPKFSEIQIILCCMAVWCIPLPTITGTHSIVFTYSTSKFPLPLQARVAASPSHPRITQSEEVPECVYNAYLFGDWISLPHRSKATLWAFRERIKV